MKLQRDVAETAMVKEAKDIARHAGFGNDPVAVNTALKLLEESLAFRNRPKSSGRRA
jgi:hypothetical protein